MFAGLQMEVIDHSSLNGKGGNAPTTTMTFSITASPHCEATETETETSIKLSIVSKSPNAAGTMFTANVSLGGGGDGGDNRDGVHASVHVSSVTRHEAAKRKLNRGRPFDAYSPNAKLVRSTTSVFKSPQQHKDRFLHVATDSQTTVVGAFEPFESFEVQSTNDSHRSEKVILPAHASPIVESPSRSPDTPISTRNPSASALAPARPPLVAHWSADILN